ncbi:MAG: DUF47 family protein [Thermoplasmata archaeon]|nr:DUF47 family protein [Thermoplasmata archaeon]
MGFKEWIIPQEKHFFDLLALQSDVILKGAKELCNLSKNPQDIASIALKIERIENEGDQLVHDLINLLNKTFVTPIDHDDLSKLTSKMDDIVDYIDSAATRMRLYEVKEIPPRMIDLINVLAKQVNEVHISLHELSTRKRRSALLTRCVEVNRLENQADDITHEALAGLFKLDDIKMIMKLKEIYEHLETATDRCEDVADIVKDIVIKNS